MTRTDVVSGAASYFLTDALGSPIAVTDSAGAVQTEYTYEPFGKTIFSGASTTSSYQYTGRENDGTDLYYYRARYYHPHLQRFISEDPIEFYGGDINVYAYVGNSPPNQADALGLRGGWKPLERLFLGGYWGWRTFSPIPVFIDGLGWVIPYWWIPPDLFNPDTLNDVPEEQDDDGDGTQNFRDPDSEHCRVNCNPSPPPPPGSPPSPPDGSGSPPGGSTGQPCSGRKC